MKKILAIGLYMGTVAAIAQGALETVVQKGHELAVLCVAVSPDSSFIATGSKDKSIKLWELATGREIRTFAGHDHWVTSLQFSGDGMTLLSGSYDKSARLWDVASGREIHVVSSDDFVTDVAIDPRGGFFIVAGYNRYGTPDSATVYSMTTKNKIRRLPIDADEGRGYGVSVSVSPDGRYVGFGEDNRVVNIYTTADWQHKGKFEFTEGWCGGCGTFLRFSPDGNTVYMGSQRGPLKKYRLPEGNLLYVYEDKIEDLTDIALSPDGKKIARAAENSVRVYDAASGNLEATLPAEAKAAFHRIAFTNDSKRLLVASDDNTAFSWNFISNRKEKIFTGYLNERDKGGLTYDPNFGWQAAIAKYVRFRNPVLITPDGKSLIKGKFGKKLRQWDISTGKAQMEFVGHLKAAFACALSRDGRKLLTGGGDGRIILWNVATGDTIRVIRSYEEPVFDIHFNSDETKSISCSWDGTMKVHDLTTGLRTTFIEFSDNSAAYNAVFHPSDLYILSARFNNAIEMWEPDTRTVVRSFVGHTDVISSVSFNTSGNTLLSSSWDGTIRLWDVGTGLMTRKIRAHRGAVYAARFSPDGKLIYSGGGDRLVKAWDAATGQLVKTYDGHSAEVTAIVFSPDNRLLITHSVDGVTKFHDLPTGKEFFEHIHLGDNDWMVRSPGGYFNGTDNARKYVHFVQGMKTFSVDQFFDDFYRPDLLPRIFQERGATGEQKGIQGKLKTSPPPAVRIAVIPAGEGRADVIVRVTDNGAGAEHLKLFHNGKNIPVNAASFKPPAGQGQTATYRHTVDLIGGANIFTATARNRDNVESDPQSAEIFSDQPSKSSICHVLAVGINQYRNQKLALNYARPDAESFSKLVDQRGTNLFKSLRIHTLYDDNATRQGILRKLDELAGEINPEDVFIFYYAGHGSMVDNQFYFIPTESSRLYDVTALSREAIEASMLQEKFRHIKALKQLIVMDACQSGGSVELLATRGASEEKAIAQLSRSAGIHVMASAGSEQFATEFNELGHGLFTYVFIRGLQGEADGAPRDGKVTIYELKSFIDDQVPEMTRKLKGKPQYPYTFSRGQDFPLAIE